MSEGIKAILVLISAGLPTIWYCKSSFQSHLQPVDIYTWRLIWLIMVVMAFSGFGYLPYLLLLVVLLTIGQHRLVERSVLAFVFLLCALPMLSWVVPGFGGINLIMTLNQPRVLAIGLLLPLFISGRLRSNTGVHSLDRAFIFYLMVEVIFSLVRMSSVTDFFRSMIYVFLDLLLPYLAISRLLARSDWIRSGLSALVISAAVLAVVNLFEIAMRWFIYQASYRSLGLPNPGLSPYALTRAGLLRQHSVFASPIVFGFYISIVITALLALRDTLGRKFWPLLGLFLLTLFSTLSRGPWLGMMVGGMAFMVLNSERPMASFIKFLLIVICGLLVLSLPGFEFFYGLIPFLGETEKGNISYRQQLLVNGFKVFSDNPLFGDPDFIMHPLMQELTTGLGIVDVVNTYIGILLANGLVGLVFWLLPWLLALRLLMQLRILLRNSDTHLLVCCNALISMLVAVLVIIATVSSIDYVKSLMVVVLGFCSALIRSGVQTKDNLRI
jgi:O-antigen ligase